MSDATALASPPVRATDVPAAAPPVDAAAPPALVWSDALALDVAPMDATHREFVDLLAAVAATPATDAAQRLARWQTLVDHTVAHFAQEDRWMADCGFAAENCHTFQHQAVLQVMHECTRRARDEGDFEPLGLAIGELAIWFPLHAQRMDAGLAAQMAEVGYDPVTGTRRGALPAQAATSCTPGGCS